MDRKWAARLAAAALLAGLTGVPSFMAGGANYTGNDNNGRLTVSGTVEGSVGGWYRVSGDAANGSVTTENGIHIENGNIFGGYTHDGNASGNEAALTGTWVIGGPSGDYSTGAVFGGYTDRGDANKNTLTINEYSTIDFQAVGGQTYDGSADNNEVRIDTSFIGRDPRDLSEEEVAQAPDAVNGGSGDSASDNKVEMTDSMSWGRVTGGAAFTGEANGNTVTISGGHVVSVAGAELTVSHVYHMIGGYATDGDAAGNGVWIENSKVSVYGRPASGYDPTSYLAGGYAVGGTADGNWLVILNSTVERTPAAGEENTNLLIAGGLGETGANKNWVLMGDADGSGSRSTVTGNYIYGGYTERGSASGNQVSAAHADLTLTEASKGLIGGWTDSGDAVSNEVQLSDSTLEADLLYGGGTKTGDARENTLLITGGADVTVTYAIGGSTEAGAASDNEITLEGDARSSRLTCSSAAGPRKASLRAIRSRSAAAGAETR